VRVRVSAASRRIVVSRISVDGFARWSTPTRAYLTRGLTHEVHPNAARGAAILPSFVLVNGIAPNCGMSIRVSAQVVIAKTLVGVSCSFTIHFHSFPFHGLVLRPTLSMLMWVLCRPFLAHFATRGPVLTTTVASTIPREIF